MRKTILFLTLIAFGCNPSSSKNHSSRQEAKKLLANAKALIKAGQLDSADVYLTKAIIMDMDSSREAARLSLDIDKLQSKDFLEKSLRGVGLGEYKEFLAGKPLRQQFFEDNSLDSLFRIKLKTNKDLSIKLIKLGIVAREQESKAEEARPSKERKAYETTLRNNFLDNNLDIQVKVYGKDNSQIALSYALFNDVWARKFQTQGLLATFKEKGFKKLTLTDNYNYTVYWDFTK